MKRLIAFVFIASAFEHAEMANGQTLFTRITTGDIVNDGGNSRGAGWADFDNDGHLDLFVANRLNNFLYQNNGDGTFTKITTGEIVNDNVGSYGISWGDYDNDNDLDLFVTNFSQSMNFLYQNNGDSTFTKITDGDIVNGGRSVGCGWGDYDNDGDLDLFVADDGGNNLLFQNNGDGTFTKIIDGDIVNGGGRSTGCSWGDYDNDGDLDLFVANFSESNFLYQNNGDGTFTLNTNSPIVNDGDVSQGGSWGDYDNDGDLDLFVANPGINFLYENNGDGSFAKITAGPVVTDFGNSFGSSWCDFDNDGDLDLFVVNADTNRSNFLYENDGSGNFTRITGGDIVSDTALFVTSVWGDYDNDGDLDLFVANGDGNNFLYRNNGNSNNWINIKLVGTVSNASAIGAKVRVKANINGNSIWQMREISGQTGYLSQNSLNAEFGLGKATLIGSIRVEWPSGMVTDTTNVAINQFLTITEPATAPSAIFTDINVAGLDSLSRSAASWGDYDNDGDLDILLSGLGKQQSDIVSKVYRNDNGAFVDINAGLAGVEFGSGIWGDYDHDGDLDILLAGSTIANVYRNDNGTFVNIAAGLIGVNVGSAAWGDYDNDGDLDILLAGRDTTVATSSRIYRNDNGTFTEIAANLAGVLSGSVAWGDYDNDRDLDVLLTGSEISKIYRNDNGAFVDIAAPLANLIGSSAAWGDYDNDGDLDVILAGGDTPNTTVTKVYRNDNGTFVDIAAALAGAADGDIDWGDYDNDGDLDIVLAGVNDQLGWISKIYRNDNGTFVDISAGLIGLNFSAVAWGDYDNDGDLDILLSGQDSQFNPISKIYRNDGGFTPNQPPLPPIGLNATLNGDEVTLSWQAGSDAETPAAGLTYNLLLVNSDTGKLITSPMASENTGVRRLPALGNVNHNTAWTIKNLAGRNYEWRVQTIDNNFTGSSFSDAAVFSKQSLFSKITTGPVVNDSSSSRGASWADYDDDGDLDLFVTNAYGTLQNDFLYQNNGDTTFTKIANHVIVSDDQPTLGHSWGDYDNDGDLDLFVANSGGNNFLYRNNGDGTATRITEGEIVNDNSATAATSWGDYNNDGNLDLVISTDDGFIQLYRNNGDSTFTRIVSSDFPIAIANARGLSWADYNNDGNLDLFVAIFNADNLLVRNNGDGSFTRITAGPVVTDGGSSFGGSWGDYDNDGDLDLFVTNADTIDNNNFLYENNGDGTFTKITSGPVVTDVGLSFGSSWGDFDNDGDLDLFVTNSSIAQSNSLYENDGSGNFTKITDDNIVNDFARSVASVWGDYDNDGDLDLFVTNANDISGENNFLYRNNGNSNNWINIKLVGTVSNKSAIGANVRVKANINGFEVWQTREISGQTGALSQNSLNAEFGLGDAAIIDSIRVEWPSGIVQVLTNAGVNQFLTITEPQIPICKLEITSPRDGQQISADSVKVKALLQITGGQPPFRRVGEVNRVPASFRGDTLLATISLSPGPNDIIATCSVVDTLGQVTSCRDSIRVTMIPFTMIDFNDLTTTGPGTGGQVIVDTQYADKGVIFNSPFALDYSKGLAIPNFAHSGTIAIEQCYSQEFCTTPIEMSFTRAQKRVKVWAGYSSSLNESRTVILRAFDASGAQVGQATTTFNPSSSPQPIRTPLEVISQSSNISRATVGFTPETLFNDGLAIDDVEFDTLSSGAPSCKLTILSPNDGQQISADNVVVIARLEVTGGQPPFKSTCKVNDIPASVIGDTVFAVIPLINGPNDVIATCTVEDAFTQTTSCRDAIRVTGLPTTPVGFDPNTTTIQEDSSVGFSNRTVNPGETIRLSIGLHNEGTEPTGPLFTVLRTPHRFVTIKDSTANFKSIPPGQSLPSFDPYVFSVDKAILPDSLAFTLIVVQKFAGRAPKPAGAAGLELLSAVKVKFIAFKLRSSSIACSLFTTYTIESITQDSSHLNFKFDVKNVGTRTATGTRVIASEPDTRFIEGIMPQTAIQLGEIGANGGTKRDISLQLALVDSFKSQLTFFKLRFIWNENLGFGKMRTDTADASIRFSRPDSLEVSGRVTYYSNKRPIRDVIVTYKDPNGVTRPTRTDTAGKYSFKVAGIDTGIYKIYANLAGVPSGALAQCDTSMARNIFKPSLPPSSVFCSLSPTLNEVYKRIAADVHRDSVINDCDVHGIAFLAFNQTVPSTCPLSIRQGWTFIDSLTSVTPNNFFMAQDTLTFFLRNYSREKMNYVGIIYGDVDGSAGALLPSSSSTATAGSQNRRMDSPARWGQRIPQRFFLLQNYPNPFNPTTRIEYGLPKDEHVLLQVFNVLGQVVYTCTDKRQLAGYYQIDWPGIDQNGKRVPAGIYLMRLQAGEFSQVRKVALVK